MLNAAQCLRLAEQAETVARVISLRDQQARVRSEAQAWRRMAAELEASSARPVELAAPE